MSKQVTDTCIIDLLDQAATVTYQKGEVIAQPNDEVKNVFVIQKGYVKVYFLDQRGDENISIIYGPNDFFPVMWLIGQEYPVTFQAMTSCTITQMPQAELLQQMENNIAICLAINKKIIEQFSQYASRVTNLGLKYGRERVIYRLLTMASQFGSKPGDDGSVTIPPISQQDLGASINVSREGVNRELSRLERLGFLTWSSSQITLHNPVALQKDLGANVIVPSSRLK